MIDVLKNKNPLSPRADFFFEKKVEKIALNKRNMYFWCAKK